MSPDSRPQPRSLAEFQLEREAAEAFGLLPAWYFDYLQPYLGATTSNDWNNFSVHKEGGGGNDVSDDSGEESDSSSDPYVQLLNYATSLPKQTYQVLNAKLLNPDGRRITEMRLHEMIQSTWATESDTELTRLGIRQIENADARRAILCEYERAASTAIKNEFLSAISQGANPAGLTVTISGEGVLSPYWNDNPFIRTAVGVAGDAYKVTAHLIKEDISNMPRMYMVMELDGAREGQTGLEGLEECPQDPRS
ncbi:hypothetical protein N0V93_004221 [Gnomoniopsis smithogilvyi]|uniref:Uncharacterized protein n=1 Tax=Gnomoniopsis smithogilvyi TaxID=1191159 RepID=A0A9W8YR34_9PEZI|nr:hypothetical protein N0V93_004221 [Gnomoniopsis smithogilvyi]